MKGYEGASECHSLSSLCDRFAWKIKVSLLNFTRKGKYGREFYQGLTLSKFALTNVLNNLLLWHSFFGTRQANSCVQMNLHQMTSKPVRIYSVGPRTHVHQCMLGSLEVCLTKLKIRELKQRWRRRQRERQKSNRYKLAKQPFFSSITLFWSNGYFANKPFFTIFAIFAHAL